MGLIFPGWTWALRRRGQVDGWVNTEDRNAVSHTECNNLAHGGDCVSLPSAPSGGRFSSEHGKAKGKQGVDEVQSLWFLSCSSFPGREICKDSSFYMPWGQRPACKGAHLKKGQRLQEVSGWEAMGFTDSARGNIGQDSQKGPETVTEMHPWLSLQIPQGQQREAWTPLQRPEAQKHRGVPRTLPCRGLSDPNGDISSSAQAGALSWTEHHHKESSNQKQLKCCSLAGGGSLLRTTV